MLELSTKEAVGQWDQFCRRNRERQLLEKELFAKLQTLAPRDAEALVYITGRKRANSWYSYYNNVTIELMLNKTSIKHTVSIYSSISNGCGGWDITGAAILTRKDVAAVCRKLFSVVVEEESFYNY